MIAIHCAVSGMSNPRGRPKEVPQMQETRDNFVRSRSRNKMRLLFVLCFLLMVVFALVLRRACCANQEGEEEEFKNETQYPFTNVTEVGEEV